MSDDTLEIQQQSTEVVEIDTDATSIVIDTVSLPPEMVITSVGSIGPRGPAGAAIVPRARRKDWNSDYSVCYEGWAEPGSSPSAAVWRIRKTVFVGDDSTETWADSNDNYDNIWDNRTSLTYG